MLSEYNLKKSAIFGGENLYNEVMKGFSDPSGFDLVFGRGAEIAKGFISEHYPQLSGESSVTLPYVFKGIQRAAEKDGNQELVEYMSRRIEEIRREATV